jgi:predicted patatin/cPLA2 family phospholipase
MKQNMGHTALMLSGGGAIAMYHLGTIKALVERRLYEHIHVISGTSGGRYAYSAVETRLDVVIFVILTSDFVEPAIQSNSLS